MIKSHILENCNIRAEQEVPATGRESAGHGLWSTHCAWAGAGLAGVPVFLMGNEGPEWVAIHPRSYSGCGPWVSPALHPMLAASLVWDRTWIPSCPHSPRTPSSDSFSWSGLGVFAVNVPFKSQGVMGEGEACQVYWSSRIRTRAGWMARAHSPHSLSAKLALWHCQPGLASVRQALRWVASCG